MAKIENILIFPDSDDEDAFLDVNEMEFNEDSVEMLLEENDMTIDDLLDVNEKINIVSLEEELTYRNCGVSDEFVRKVDERSVNIDDLRREELTNLLRCASLNEYVADLVQREFHMRPLPSLRYMRVGSSKSPEFTLYPYQIDAINFMRDREALSTLSIKTQNTNIYRCHDGAPPYGLCGGILYVQLGLGKTIISMAHSLTAARPSCSEKGGERGFPTLIVASKTLMDEWRNQFNQFFGNRIKVLYLHKDYLGNDINKVNREIVCDHDFVVTTYDVCATECKKHKHFESILVMGDEHTLMKGKVDYIDSRLRSDSNKPNLYGAGVIYGTPWERVICDESQRFANPKTKTFRYIMAIYGRYKWCLSGTPIRNYETDIWAQLRFCGYDAVKRTIEWKRRGASYLMKQHRLNDAIFKLCSVEAGVELPEKIRVNHSVELSGKQKECYEAVRSKAIAAYDLMMQGLTDFASVLALFTRLRQCAIAPYLITKESKRDKKDKDALANLKDLFEGTLGAWVYDKYGEAGIESVKIRKIIEEVGKIPEGEKVIIFSMFVSLLDLLADAFDIKMPDYKYCQVDGGVTGKSRYNTLEYFRESEECRCLLMTYKVGSEGLNLTEANHIICVEPWWTPSVHKQAEGREWRKGQTKDVIVHNIYVQDSIEDRIIEICDKKNKLSGILLDGDDQPISTGIDKFTMGKILGRR